MFILSVIAEPKKKLYYAGGVAFTTDINSAKTYTTRTDALIKQEELMTKYELDIQIESL